MGLTLMRHGNMAGAREAFEDVLQLLLVFLDFRDVGKQRNLMRCLATCIANCINGQRVGSVGMERERAARAGKIGLGNRRSAEATNAIATGAIIAERIRDR